MYREVLYSTMAIPTFFLPREWMDGCEGWMRDVRDVWGMQGISSTDSQDLVICTLYLGKTRNRYF